MATSRWLSARWAALNPAAQLREPITLADHQASRWIVEPFHLLDCCLVSNGGIAVIVTTAERAAALAQPPVHVLGWAQAHPGHYLRRDPDFGLVSGAASAGPAALAMAGLDLADVDVVELYDCYTFTVLLTLEDYGFCAKGEGGPFVASGVLGPAGKLRLNTGGGQLSGYYMWGMTPLSEAVIQARGHGGARQSPAHDVVLVSGNGGVLDHHATLVLASRGGRDMSVGPVVRDEATAEFFDGAAAGQFLLRRCAGWSCQRASRSAVHDLRGDRPALGPGRRRRHAGELGGELERPAAGEPPRQTVLVIGELDEGPWWWTQLAGRPSRRSARSPPGAGCASSSSGRDAEHEAVPVFVLA